MKPGWYDDPHDRAAQRWWDGAQWSPNARPRPRGIARWVALAVGLLLLLVLVGVGGVGMALRARRAAPVQAVGRVDVRPDDPRVGNGVSVRLYVRTTERPLSSFRLTVHHGRELAVREVVLGRVDAPGPTTTDVTCTLTVRPADETLCGISLDAKQAGPAQLRFELRDPDGRPLVDATGLTVALDAALTVKP